MNLTQLSETVYVSGQISPADLPALNERGFSAVICNRPDGEDPGQPNAQEIQEAASAAGLLFFHVPFDPQNPSETMVADFADALDAAPEGRVLAYCRSGNRSGRLWQASGAR